MRIRKVKSGEYRNYISLSEMNRRALLEPAEFIASCEEVYGRELQDTAAYIAGRMHESPVVLISGPSASGKTTTAHLLSETLAGRGIGTRTVSLDNYFLTVDRDDTSIDYEAPERLDIPLVVAHMEALTMGEEVLVPRFDFLTGARAPDVVPMRLGRDEVAIFEGIHALNDLFFSDTVHPPTGIYVSVRMRVTEGDRVLLPPDGARFVRRCVRDNRVRNSDFSRTLALWDNVRRGETQYIMPFKHRAELAIDTSFDYELNLLARFAREDMKTVDREGLRRAGLEHLPAFLDGVADIDPALVPAHSLLREFVGNAGISEQKNC